MGTDGSPHGGTLLGRAMLGQLVVVAINYDFVRTVKSYDLTHIAERSSKTGVCFQHDSLSTVETIRLSTNVSNIREQIQENIFPIIEGQY